MSLAEIETAIKGLSSEDKQKLYESLGLEVIISDERKAEWGRIMREMDEGKKFTFEQVDELMRQLELKGS